MLLLVTDALELACGSPCLTPSSTSFVWGRSSSLTSPRLDSRDSLWCEPALTDLSMATVSRSSLSVDPQPTFRTLHTSQRLIDVCDLSCYAPPHSRQSFTFCSHGVDGGTWKGRIENIDLILWTARLSSREPCVWLCVLRCVSRVKGISLCRFLLGEVPAAAGHHLA